MNYTTEEILSFSKSINNKFNKVRENLNNYFYEREITIDQVLLAIFAKDNTFIYGPTGTGKTELIRCIMSHFPFLKLYIEQGGHDTTKDDIFGPIDIKKFTNGESYERMKKNFALEADVIFIDEFNDMPERVQRSLLGISSKNRFFRDGSNQITWNGRTCLFASNFFRNTEQSKAINDRILLKSSVHYLNNSLEEYLLSDNKKYNHNNIFFTKEELDKFDDIIDQINVSRTGKLLTNIIFSEYNLELEKEKNSSREQGVFSNLPRMSDRALKEFINIIKIFALLCNNISAIEELNIDNKETTKSIFVKNQFVFNICKYLAPSDGNHFNNSLLNIIKTTEKDIYSKICNIKFPMPNPKTGKIEVFEKELNIATKYAIDMFYVVYEKLKDVNQNDTLSSSWDIKSNSSTICFLKTVFSSLYEATKNPDIFKKFPIISIDDSAIINNINESLEIIISHIKANGENHNNVTYKDILEIIENKKIIKQIKTKKTNTPNYI